MDNDSVEDYADDRIQSLEQEQQDLLEQVDAENNPADAPSSFGAQADDGSAEANSENDVQAAFGGLEQIDQARSGETVPAPVQQPVEPADNPFAEDFEEEVLLHEAYSPFVAEQNKSSLTVTSEHLSYLKPNDEVEAAEAVQEEDNSASTEFEASSTDLPSGFVVPPPASPTSYIPVQSVSTELRFPEPPQSFEPQEPVEEIDPDLAALTSDFSFDEETPSNVQEEGTYAEAAPVDGAKFEEGIHDQTADMAQDLRNTIDSNVSPETEDPFSQQPADVSEQNTSFSADDAPEAVTAGEPEAVQYAQQPPLDESQQVLREILAQQQIVNDNQYSQPQPNEEGVDSISVEYPITDHANYQPPSDQSNDDRDMLRVNESHYAQTPQQPDQPTPYADAEPSTGEAQRMDYSKLFDQLRNMPKE